MKGVLFIFILVSFAFEGMALSSPREGKSGPGNMKHAQTTGPGERDETSLVMEKALILNQGDTRHSGRKKEFETNRCIRLRAELEGACRPSTKREPAERFLEETFFPFEREDHLGSLVLSVSEENMSFGLRNIFGEEIWVLRWNFSSGG